MVSPEVRLIEPIDPAGGRRIWLADQLDWKKKVVVELFARPSSDADAAVERFIETAATCQELESSHLVRVHDFGVTEDFQPFAVVEHLAGETLAQRLARDDRLELDEVATIVGQLGIALDEAHDLGLLHLGICPERVFLRAGSTVDAVLLGLVGRPLASVDRKSSYASPELYFAKQPDRRADGWSLAAVAYRCLTGQEAVEEEKRRLMKWEIELPSELWVDVPDVDALDRWCERALHRQPDKRYGTTGLAARALGDLAGGAAVVVAGSASMPVVAVGSPASPAETRSSDIVVQEASDDAPAIVVEVDD
jgi:serine/threonine protein kinase